jgi:hypothetical protein
MRLSFRYSLIIGFVALFLITAPLILLFLSGTRYDFENKRFVKTGIVTARTSPRGADVYINGKLVDTTPSSIRFLEPGDYDITIQKQGYFPWSKRLHVKAQYVTWVNQAGPLLLFRSTPKRTPIEKEVIDIHAGSSKFIYLTKTEVRYGDISDPENTKSIALPRRFETGTIQASTHNQEIFLLRSGNSYAAIVDTSAGTIYDITSTALSPAPTTPAIFELTDGGKLYLLQDNTLYYIDWRGKTKKEILKHTLAFFPAENSIYSINIPHSDLAVTLPNDWQNYNLIRTELLTNTTQVLKSHLPKFERAELYLTGQNQAFVLGDGSLYAVQNELKRIADSVIAVTVDVNTRTITYATRNEISVYNLDSLSSYSVTRSAEPIYNPVAVSNVGWAFYDHQGKLNAVEYDDRDRQNTYSFANISDNAKFFVSPDARFILLLDKGSLELLEIRHSPSLLLPHG